MRKILSRVISIILIASLCMIATFNNAALVSAEGSITVSTNSIELHKGDEKRFVIRANNAAASIDITSDDEDVAIVDYDSVWLDNDYVSVTVTAVGVGECNIVVDVVDGATYDETVISTSFNIAVRVVGEIGPQQIATPYASEESGEVAEGTALYLNCEIPDAVIHYSINEGDYEIYSDALILSNDMLDQEDCITLEIYADKNGNYYESEHVTYTYTLTEKQSDYGDLLPEDIEEYEDADDVPAGFWMAGVTDMEYNGKAQKQDHSKIRVYYHTKLLKENTDYSITYKNNVNCSNNGAYIVINGKGNYSGSFSKSFSITPISISDVVVDDLTLKFNGKNQNVSPKVVLNGKTLRKNTDYIINTESVSQVGSYNVNVIGIGNYKGSIPFGVVVTDKKPISEVPVNAIKPVTYNGQEYKPEVLFKEFTLNKNKITLVEGRDYTVEYDDDCISAGTHRIIIRATDNVDNVVAGTRILTYNIKGLNLSMYNSADLVTAVYTGSEVKQNNPDLYRTVKNGGQSQREYLDPEGNYEISYVNNDKAGTATIIYTGINGYTGTVKKTFKILPAELTIYYPTTVTMDEHFEYVKGGVCPEPVVKYRDTILTKNVDYKISYKNNNKINDNSNSKTITSLTITGKGNYKGSVTKNFTISSKSINNTNIVADDCSPGTRKSNVRIFDINGKQLGGTDYVINKICYNENVMLKNGTQRYKGETIYFKDDIPANTVLKVFIKGKGNYSGSATALYKTYEKKISSVRATIKPQEYTGNPVTLTKNDIELVDGKNVLSNSDFEIVSYKNNVKKGSATVTIRGKGTYGGTKDIKFVISNKTMSLKITFDGNGATSGKMSDQEMSSPTALKANSYKRNGYTFGGWRKEGSSLTLEDREIYPYLAENAGKKITLLAIWFVNN